MNEVDDLLAELEAIDSGNFSGASSKSAPASVRPAWQQTPPHHTPKPSGGTGTINLDALLQDLNMDIALPPAQRAASGGLPSGVASGKGTGRRRSLVLDVDAVSAALGVAVGGAAPAALPAGDVRLKCTAVHIGGAGQPSGRYPGVGPVTCCDALRCTKCDCRVVAFPDAQWRPAVANYMFFRNNYPTGAKLSEALQRAPGRRAYCCQCSWAAAGEVERLQLSGELRWACGGHAS